MLALRVSHGVHRRILDALADAVVACDAADRITYASPSITTLLGWTPEELVGRHVIDLIPPRLRAAHRAGFQRFVSTGVGAMMNRPVRVAAQHRDGQEREIELTLAASGAGAEPEIVAAMRDVGERLALERVTASHARIAAQYAVMQALAAAVPGADPLGAVLAAAGAGLDFEAAVYWAHDGAGGLRAIASWDGGALREFVGASAAMALGDAEGMLGLVWQDRQPRAFAPADEPRYRRRELAIAHGVARAVVVPVACTARGFGVIELLSRRATPADDELLQTIATIGFQLGQWLERREVEAHATRLIDELPQIVWVCAADGRVERYNRRWYEYVGDAAVDAAASVHPEDGPMLAEGWPRAFAAGATFEVEVRLRRHDGVYRWHLNRTVPLRDATGAITGWVGTATDIDERRQVAERRRFLDRAGAVLASSLDPEVTLRRLAELLVPSLADWCTIYIVDPERATPRRLVAAHADPAKVAWAEELHRQFPPDPSSPRGVYHVIRTGEAEYYPEISDEVLAAAISDPRQLAIVRSLGMRSAMTLPLTARGATIGALTLISAESGHRYEEADLAFARELAERAALAVDNARLYQDAQEAVRVRDDFLSIASHELKTPLTPLQLHVDDLIRRAGGDGPPLAPERVGAKLGTVARQVDRITALVDGLLDISRITQGRLQIDREQLDLAALVREIVDRFRGVADRAGCHVLVEAPPALSACLDRLRVEQIVSNLVSNAIKFGAGEPVEVRLVDGRGVATITVKDHGIGIADADQARIFDRFERAVSTRHYGGFGLGLWISRQIVEALGGTIRVESTIGAGATFEVVLPLAPGARHESPRRVHDERVSS